ncbi:hypothetical protein DVH24_032859 [Malus domestica]|uniref:Tim10-like domain-containing protein n=1 Tax=Malus domestica TaxID=3750 RepID=A0A498IR04_MALDO|nr:hypothetical protein DVH24_032859 [Malus domestica]
MVEMEHIHCRIPAPPGLSSYVLIFAVDHTCTDFRVDRMLIDMLHSCTNLTGVGNFKFVYNGVVYTDNRARLVPVDMKVFNKECKVLSKTKVLFQLLTTLDSAREFLISSCPIASLKSSKKRRLAYSLKLIIPLVIGLALLASVMCLKCLSYGASKSFIVEYEALRKFVSLDTFKHKSLQKQEETCVRRCAEKFLKHSMRVGIRLAEHNQGAATQD